MTRAWWQVCIARISFSCLNLKRLPLLVATEVSYFLFGDGFAVATGEHWRGRRKAVAPALHRAYLERMLELVFGPSSLFACDKLSAAAATGSPVNMEAIFSQV